MIAEVLNAAIAILLVVLVAAPAALAITRTLRERRKRRNAAELRDRHASEPANSNVPPQPQSEREPTEVYRRLTGVGQNARQSKPGDRVRSREEALPGG